VTSVEAGVAGAADGDEDLLIIIITLPMVNAKSRLPIANLTTAVAG
jgi:hypothetical protein